MGFAKYMEDNLDYYFENNEYKDNGFHSGVLIDGRCIGGGYEDRKPERLAMTDYKPSYKLRKERERLESDNYNCSTRFFTVKNNCVSITTNNNRVFWALKCSLKEAGGKFNAADKSWHLSDEKLAAWIKSEKKYKHIWEKSA